MEWICLGGVLPLALHNQIIIRQAEELSNTLGNEVVNEEKLLTFLSTWNNTKSSGAVALSNVLTVCFLPQHGLYKFY